MNEIGPFRIWRAIFALAVTASVCIAIYLLVGVKPDATSQQKAATGVENGDGFLRSTNRQMEKAGTRMIGARG